MTVLENSVQDQLPQNLSSPTSFHHSTRPPHQQQLPHLRHAHHQHHTLENFPNHNTNQIHHTSATGDFLTKEPNSIFSEVGASSNGITGGSVNSVGDSAFRTSELSPILSKDLLRTSSSSTPWWNLSGSGGSLADSASSTLTGQYGSSLKDHRGIDSISNGSLLNQSLLNRTLLKGSNFINGTLPITEDFSEASSERGDSWPLPSLSFNFSSSEMEEIHNISNITFFAANTTALGNDSAAVANQRHLSPLYMYIVPCMLFFCVLTFLVNLIIVISARWCRKPMSPTLYFSISLALADAYASLTLGIGLVVNSLLPHGYGIKWASKCPQLTIEAFRQGGVLVTVFHFLALGINHWIGIVRPLHYAATMTRRTAWIVIILSWICPILVQFTYFSSVSDEGYRSNGCSDCSFLKKRTYRAFFASCVFGPLILMSVIYIHIFIIVRNHQTHRLRYQSCHQLQRNVKAVLTTILILGTYVIGWVPAILYNIIFCDDCLYQLEEIAAEFRLAVGVTVNWLVILKGLIDPIIYAARMNDVQLGLKKMRYDFLLLFCKPCTDPVPPPDHDRGLSQFNRSVYDSHNKSVRVSSFRSNSSCGQPRAAAAASANLIIDSNNSPEAQSNQNRRFNNSTNRNQNGNKSANHLSPSAALLQHKSSYEMTEMR